MSNLVPLPATERADGLVRVEIYQDTNEYGEKNFMVTPYFRHRETGQVFSVPDTKGWPTSQEAMLDALRLAGVEVEITETGAVVRPV